MSSSKPDVVYVNECDEVIGHGSIARAIENGIIRRVARVVLFDGEGNVYLQRRSKNIAMPLLWNESATGHVDRGEERIDAALRELKEEIGVSGVLLHPVRTFYFEEYENGVAKRAFHTVFIGMYKGPTVLDPEEVDSLKLVSVPDAISWLTTSPEEFAGGAVETLREVFISYERGDYDSMLHT